ncbi:peptidoglycan editing factor PgeF [Vibrio sinensis]|uniref:Purine nucleoside phosphorylase n=1 Tax=Vibrio sinensis TaxID=2302434 RepID=A0A3A6QI19_9VIBR|nr:peptidoglycan editing factor PgeF [Vibrio sinensis]RJX70412.1 peptidoglycan editing factor PgeF [Vibrio sinensis]
MELIIPNWPAPSQIKSVASTRFGGLSQSPYQGLNLGTHVGDDKKTVENNRLLLQKNAHMPSSPIWLNQTHSTRVIECTSPTDSILDADGIFTSNTNVICSAMTADCLPVLLTNVQGTQVAAVHAGWRGLADGIVENALDLFDGEVMAWLGPAIGPTAFEVGQDVLDAFVSFDANAHDAFIAKEEEGKWYANMVLLATQRLNSAGVKHVYGGQYCTYSDRERFYSYRRDGVTGRLASFIWIEA